MSVDFPKSLVPKFFNHTAPTYDKIAFWATFGRDNYWKNKIIQQIDKIDSCLDLACGTGILTRKIARKFPNAKIVGVDITKGYLEKARKNSKKYPNVSFFLQDAEKLNLDSKFDCITSSYIPKYCNANTLIKKCKECLKPQGKIVLHDFTHPKNTLIQKLWDMHFILLNFMGFFVPSWKKAFFELPKLIRSSTWVKSYETALKNNGFDTSYEFYTFGTSCILIGTRNQK